MADLFMKYRCGYCQDEILGVRVRCNVCVDYELCLQCFSLGCEIGPHKSSHSYKLLDPGTFSIFPEKNVIGQPESDRWIAREEYQLLDAIEQFGYGNFEDVAKHVETRDSERAKEYYCRRFVNGTIGRATWPALPDGLLSSGEERLTAIDHTCPENSPLSPSLASRLPPLLIQTEEMLELGYMPQRDDYEKEHDNEAESVVSHLSINHDDEDIDLALKLAQVDIFTRRLRERARRKRVARDFQLVSQFFNSMKKEKEKPAPAAKKREAQKEKEMQERFRVFSQFHTATEHEQFLRNLAKERALRLRIRELIKYRRTGITRQEECTEYERARYFRERRKEARQERQKKKSFSSTPGFEHILALANEEGKIALQNTKVVGKARPILGYQAHDNAIFDLCWVPIVFASGSRDGSIMIWDTRINNASKAENVIRNAHPLSSHVEVRCSRTKRKATPSNVGNNTVNSVTAVVFQSNHTLISAGATDGNINIWDLRKNYTVYKGDPLPKYRIPYGLYSNRSGITSLCLDPSRIKLYAASMDDVIYEFNVVSYDDSPMSVYGGHEQHSFYIKTCLSGDGKYLLSGSSDDHAYIWKIGAGPRPLLKLEGHGAEVTCVAWCPNDITNVMRNNILHNSLDMALYLNSLLIF
nr:EOG090X058A [Leptodora kindtii]